VIAILMAVWGGLACSNRDPGPTALIGEHASRIDPGAAKRQFVGEGDWRVLDDWRRDPREGRSPAHILRVWIEPYTDLGHRGGLMLSFFNDQLDSTTFFPSEMTSYLSDLQARRGLKLPKGVEQKIAPGTRVYTGVNLTQQAYVAWEDGALVDQRRTATD
jgi:hypothetical protein